MSEQEKICPIMSRSHSLKEDLDIVSCQKEKCQLWVEDETERHNFSHCGLIDNNAQKN